MKVFLPATLFAVSLQMTATAAEPLHFLIPARRTLYLTDDLGELLLARPVALVIAVMCVIVWLVPQETNENVVSYDYL